MPQTGSLRRLVRRAIDSRIGIGLSQLADRAFMARQTSTSQADGSEGHRRSVGILAGPGEGNIGDHAMLQTVLAHYRDARCCVIAEVGGVYDYLQAADVAVCVMPALLSGRGPEQFRASKSFATLASGFDEFVVIGADMMDGGYGRLGACRRWSVAANMATAGIPTRILGCSWNEDPDPVVLWSARRATRHGVEVLARDPHSLQRAKHAGLQNVTETRDVVFSHKFQGDSGTDGAISPYAVVNVSGLISARADLTDDYVAIVTWLLAHRLNVRLLAHVTAGDFSDVPCIEALARIFEGDPRVTATTDQLQPSAVLSLVAPAAIAVTGRMHLAILSLSCGTPAIVMSTQGKVAGLMESFGIPEACIEPATGMSNAVTRVAERLIGPGDAVRKQLLQGAALARELGERNFQAIDAVRA